MKNKIILIICDGLGDRPIKEFNGQTPLEFAMTPNLDKIAQKALKGMMSTLGVGKAPGSAVAHLSIFGYDPDQFFPGRGCIEALGLGMDLGQGDVAFRGNFSTVDDKMNVIDRRAGRIETAAPLVNGISGMKIDDVVISVKSGIAHRVGLVLSGPGLSSQVTDSDPHNLNEKVKKVRPIDDSKAAQKTADILNEFSLKAYEILNSHSYNIERVSNGKLPGNFLLLRGAGQYMRVPSFFEKYDLPACCITGGGLYRGLGRYLGMDAIEVPNATGTKDSDIEAKFKTAINNLKKYDFVFIHVKATDNAGHDGNYIEKKEVVEKIDRAAEVFKDIDESTLIVFTGDHSTPCSMKEHSADPVPIMFYGYGVRPDLIECFNEVSCMQGGAGYILGMDVMPMLLGLIGKTKVIGT